MSFQGGWSGGCGEKNVSTEAVSAEASRPGRYCVRKSAGEAPQAVSYFRNLRVFFFSSPCCHVGWRWGALINMCTRNCQAPASWSESSKRSVLLGTGMLCVELAHAADGYTTTVPKHTLSSIEIPESNGTNTTRVRQPNKGSTVTVIQPNPFH